jgi:hypothetical protein
MMTILYGPKATVLSAALTVAVSCGGLFLTTNLCRELGKHLEAKLYQEWGGKPTTQLLRHRDTTIEAVTKRRYHLFLAGKINEAFPDAAQEGSSPQAADEMYQSGVRWLLNHTRPDDDKKFDLIFKENVAYGFRRNALGMKPVGLVISIGSFLWVLASELVRFGSGHVFVDPAALLQTPDSAIASLVVSVAMALVWISFFTKASARSAAFTYAETLLRACDSN